MVQELAQVTTAALENPATLLLALWAREVTVRQGLPFPAALLLGIHTCVLNSCLWSPGGDPCCGCGSGSGGACVGPGSASETSAVPGKLIWSVSASAPETVIWREHTQSQCLRSAPRDTSQTLLSNKYPVHQHSPAPTALRADHPHRGQLLPPGLCATTKMPVGYSVCWKASRKSSHHYSKHVARARAELTTLRHSQVRPL